jgi:hypothetical protein
MIKEKKMHSIILVIFSLSMLLSATPVIFDDQEFINRDEIENYLKTADVVSRRVISKGRTRAWDIHLDDGKTKRIARFKHINLIRPENLLADSYTYEVAAYELDKMLELEIMPPIVERKINEIGGQAINPIKGSVQFFIEDCFSLEKKQKNKMKPPDEKRFRDELAQVSIFENLTYNKRVNADVLIHESNWKVCRVDFSQAFAPVPDLFPDFKPSRCSKKLFHNLKKLDQKTIQAKLGNFLCAEEIENLTARKELIIKKMEELIAQKSETAVLF